jgi:hypothetical protein
MEGSEDDQVGLIRGSRRAGSFEDIFEALRRIGFKMRSAVGVGKVGEFVAPADPSVRPIRSLECPVVRTEIVKGWFQMMKPVQVPVMRKWKVKDCWPNELEIDLLHGITGTPNERMRLKCAQPQHCRGDVWVVREGDLCCQFTLGGI